MSKPVNPSIQTRLNALDERIQQACIDSGRDRKSVTLIGVSKTKPARNVAEAYNLGLTHFGENYLQEAVSKIEELRDAFAKTTDPTKRKELATAVQVRESEYPTFAQLGQFNVPMAFRKTITGSLSSPAPVFWNIKKAQ